jgi:AcrR family transcriptional regulator
MAAASEKQTKQDTRILSAALTVFREQGYPGATLEQIAVRAKIELETVHTRFRDKGGLLAALLAAHNPQDEVLAVFDAVEGESAEDIVRDAMRRMVKVIEQNEEFVELAALDVQFNNGTFLGNMSLKIAPKAGALLERLKGTGQLRPVSDAIMARTLVSMLMGFVLSERAMPQMARMAMRLFPQRAWIDGMVDLLLFGILEDNAR